MSKGLKTQVVDELSVKQERTIRLQELEAELKRAEKALRRERNRAQQYFDIAGVILVAIDSAEEVMDINKKGCEILGYKEREIVGRNWFENFLPERVRNKVKSVFAKLMVGENEGVGYFENPVLTKDGEERNIGWHNAILKDEAGNVTGVLSSGEDITERKQAQEALRKSEEQNHLFLQNIPGIAFLCFLDFTPVLIRGAIEAITGYTEDDFMAGKQRWDRNIHPEDLGMTRKTLKEMSSIPNYSTEQDYRVIHKDRTIRWLHMTVSNICDDSGKPFMIQGVGHDITRRKRTELALQESESRYQTLFNSGNDAVCVSQLGEDGVPGKFIEVNGVACKRLGYTREEMLKLSPKDIVAHGKLSKVRANMKKLLAKKHLLFESVDVAKDGTRIPVEINVHLLKLNGYLTMLSTARDITERKQVEEALRESEERFRSLFNNVAVGVCLVDRSGRILSANKADCDFLGYSEEEMVGMHFREFTYPEDLTKSLTLHNMLVEGRRSNYVIDKRYVRKDGKVVWGRASVSLIRDDLGNPQYTAVVREDITEQKKAEKSLRQSYARLQRVLEGTVNTLAAIVEMRDPYTAGHQQRVAQLACAIAVEMGLPEKKVEIIDIAGRLHDIGKVSVPTEILSKPGKINEFEFEIIKGHPRVGHDILKQIEFEWPIVQIILQHHERMDGSSYPRGLAGEEILLEARIIAVADVVEAMSSHRPYRPALGIDKALEEIQKNKGILYDVKVVDACVQLFTKKQFRFS